MTNSDKGGESKNGHYAVMSFLNGPYVHGKGISKFVQSKYTFLTKSYRTTQSLASKAVRKKSLFLITTRITFWSRSLIIFVTCTKMSVGPVCPYCKMTYSPIATSGQNNR